MKLTATANGEIKISQLYIGIILEADDGVIVAICQRDGRFEMHNSVDNGRTWSEWEVYPAAKDEATS